MDDFGFDLHKISFVWYCKGQLKHHLFCGYIRTALLKELLSLAVAGILHKNSEITKSHPEGDNDIEFSMA